MSIATGPAQGLDSATMTDPTTTGGDAPAGVKKCPGECPCNSAEGHVLGGLPYVVTVTMTVAGLPSIDVAELHGQIGKVVAGPALVSAGTDGEPYGELENIRSLEVVGPTYADIYRAAAGSLAEAIPGLHKLAAESDEADTGEDGTPAEAAPTEAEAEVPGCARETTSGAWCPGSAGPLAGGEAADPVDSPEANPHR